MSRQTDDIGKQRPINFVEQGIYAYLSLRQTKRLKLSVFPQTGQW